MNLLPMIFCAVFGMLVCWVAVSFIQTKLRFLNRSDLTQFHHAPIAPVSRLGGLALALAFIAVALVISFMFSGGGGESRIHRVIFFSSLAMFLLGFWDDLRPLGAKRKLLGQILIASAACLGGVGIQHLKNPLSGIIYELGFWGPIASVFWLVAITNLINLIDGIDGLAGGIALMLMGLLAYSGLGVDMPFTALYAAGMAGALVGFLRFNFPPAKIYMGDGGAYFIGFLIASLSTVNSHKGTIMTALIAPLFVLALPVTDVSLAIIRRGLRGLPLFRADRKHIHHRLIDLGLSRTRAVLVLYFICLVFLVLGFFVFWSQGRWAPALFGVACAILLISAHSFSFSREWFSVGRVLGSSLGVRKSTQHALTLSRWLELEAERCDSVESLWADFRFLAVKLGFSSVKIVLQDGERGWKSDHVTCSESELRHHRRTLMLHQPMEVAFTAEPQFMNNALFEHLCDLASEAWHKSALRWSAVNQLPFRLDSRVEPQDFGPLQRKSRALGLHS